NLASVTDGGFYPIITGDGKDFYIYNDKKVYKFDTGTNELILLLALDNNFRPIKDFKFEDGKLTFTSVNKKEFKRYTYTVDPDTNIVESSDKSNSSDDNTPTTPDTNPETHIYDVNLDGKFNIKDATFIQKFLANIVDFNDDNIRNADVNDDNKINIKDATTLQKILAGIAV
ncbi:MAG: dockerin type I repeat-containing protein, partial [Ruminococcus sp.]|nr:dockerin type I repeat-containing protein [Ruminococcus sp.]